MSLSNKYIGTREVVLPEQPQLSGSSHAPCLSGCHGPFWWCCSLPRRYDADSKYCEVGIRLSGCPIELMHESEGVEEEANTPAGFIDAICASRTIGPSRPRQLACSAFKVDLHFILPGLPSKDSSIPSWSAVQTLDSSKGRPFQH
jgi:hypothetical protein